MNSSTLSDRLCNVECMIFIGDLAIVSLAVALIVLYVGAIVTVKCCRRATSLAQ